MKEISFVEFSKKTRKIDKAYLSVLTSFISHMQNEKKKWVERVNKEPRLLDTYDCLRLSVDILGNYKCMAETASPNDNPKVIDYALPTLEVVDDCLRLVKEIEESIKQKKVDLESCKKKSRYYSTRLQDVGKNYLTDFDTAIQKIPKTIVVRAVSILNKEIEQEFG